jgi:deazaflavin-dependent oxidoreductase (nitroreductase family)
MASTSTAAPRFVRPGFFMAHVVNPIVKLIGAPTLTVRGRKTGRLISVPLASFEYEGARYLVGGRGETQWVRNLRAAGEGRLRIGGKDQEFRAIELQGAERVRILTAYRKQLGRRVESFFAALPDPSDHAVFRLVTPPQLAG